MAAAGFGKVHGDAIAGQKRAPTIAAQADRTAAPPHRRTAAPPHRCSGLLCQAKNSPNDATVLLHEPFFNFENEKGCLRNIHGRKKLSIKEQQQAGWPHAERNLAASPDMPISASGEVAPRHAEAALRFSSAVSVFKQSLQMLLFSTASLLGNGRAFQP